MTLRSLFTCPCCKFPTLEERASWNICPICWWEDDGQNDERGEEVWGGPNGRYSLFEARRNFEHHGHMYEAGQGIAVVEKPTVARLELLKYVNEVRDGKDKLDLRKLQALILLDRNRRDRDQHD